MRPSEVRNLSDGELETRLRELEEEIFGLKLRRATSQLENPMKLQAVRRDLARVRTVQRERTRTA